MLTGIDKITWWHNTNQVSMGGWVSDGYYLMAYDETTKIIVVYRKSTSRRINTSGGPQQVSTPSGFEVYKFKDMKVLDERTIFELEYEQSLIEFPTQYAKRNLKST